MSKKRGQLIVVEGVDGSGKGTVVEALRREFTGDNFLFLREPGGTDVSERIREVLLNTEFKPGHAMATLTEKLLFYAARAQLATQIALPALASGKTVFLDRSDPSTFAYQIRGRENHDLEELFYVLAGHVWKVPVEKLKSGTPIYDLVLYLDVPTKVGRERVRKSRGSSGDRIERRNLSYHNRVRRGYLELSKRNLFGRWEIIDATQKPEVVCQSAVMSVKRLLGS